MKRIRESIEQYQRHLSAVAILLAFIIDSVTLVRIDFYLTYLLLMAYLAVAGAGIIIINLYEDGRARFISEEAYRWLFIAIQFSFGGLFGRFLIYYSRSGSIFASWPFLLILAALLIGNEFAKKHYTRLVLQVSFLFLALFSFLIFFIPILLGQMSDQIFLLSGFVSLVIIACFVWLLLFLVPRRVNDKRMMLRGSIGSVFLVMNVLYFTNIIPPLPLAIREAGVYHSVARTTNGYAVTHEVESPFAFLMPYQTVRLLPSDTISVYSAVFAPTNFDTSVIHDWQYYDPSNNQWISKSKVTLPVVGGQDNGYRGYSIKTSVTPGYWRVAIETLRGQVIGQLEFKIEFVAQEPALITDNL